MAFDLTTGPGLVAAISDTLNRTDLPPGVVESWVRLFEAQASNVLRVREMLDRVTSTISTEYTALPAGLLEIKTVFVNSPDSRQRSLEYAAPEDLQSLKHRYLAGSRPLKYTLMGCQIEVAPVPVEPIEVQILYYKKVAPLDLMTPGATNWLLAKAPHLYYYGALVQSAQYLLDDDRLQNWMTFAEQAIEGLNQADSKAAHGGSRLTAITRTFG